MLLSFFFLFYCLIAWKNKTSKLSIFLALFLSISASSGYLVGNFVELYLLKDIFNLVYTIIILYIFVSSFEKYKITRINNAFEMKIKIIYRIMIFVSLLSFVVNSYVFYKTMNAGIENLEVFKNSELGSDFRYSLPIPHFYISLASLLSPSSFFMISFAFYFLYMKSYKKAFWSLILSFNMPLQGFTMFSRSWTIQYFLLLIVYAIFIYSTLDLRMRRSMRKMLIIVTLPLIMYFVIVTDNRFQDYQYSQVQDNSLIKNNSFNSIIDYFSQWYKNGNYVMSNFYDIDNIQFAASSNTLLPEIASTLGIYERKNLSQERAKVWPNPYFYTFNGLVANLVFDFGYLFTFLFALFYRKIALYIGPKNGETTIYNFLNFGVIITLPLLSFTNNYLANSFYNYAILYSLIIGIFLNVKINNKIE